MNIRPARVGDVPAIYELIRTFADRKLMIRRSMGELYESIREFLVAIDDESRVVGCAALHVFWEDLAELKCLAVAEEVQGQGSAGCWSTPAGTRRVSWRSTRSSRSPTPSILRAVRLSSDRQGRAASQDLERMRSLSALSQLSRSRADPHVASRSRRRRHARSELETARA